MKNFGELARRIEDKKFVVDEIGLGYVGSPIILDVAENDAGEVIHAALNLKLVNNKN